MKSLRYEILLCRVLFVGRWACSLLVRELAPAIITCASTHNSKLKSNPQRRAWRPRHAEKSLHQGGRWHEVTEGERSRHSLILANLGPCAGRCKRKTQGIAPSPICILQNLLRPHFANGEVRTYQVHVPLPHVFPPSAYGRALRAGQHSALARKSTSPHYATRCVGAKKSQRTRNFVLSSGATRLTASP